MPATWWKSRVGPLRQSALLWHPAPPGFPPSMSCRRPESPTRGGARPPGFLDHEPDHHRDEDHRRRQSDRTGLEGLEKADAQGWPVPRDEAACRLRQAVRQAEAETGRGPKEAAQGDATNGTPQ